MKQVQHVGVIDIGKTNAKVAAVDLVKEREIGVLTRPNHVLPGPPYPHYDVDGHWAFIRKALAQLHRDHRLDAISITTHGASIVLLDDHGHLATPVLDYEFDGPDSCATEYDAVRPFFAETGSPRLTMGLNVGAQLFWQLRSDNMLLDQIKTVLTYPQYWAFRLTGITANEVTSLGCHTDLWCPMDHRYSKLVEHLRLGDKMAPVRSATDRLGTLLPQVATETGLPTDLPVFCGIHDSNASLYPHLLKRNAPFSIVSTGTWVIVLSVGGQPKTLDPARDTLINVNALGDPVPSARFMGGREYDMTVNDTHTGFTEIDITNVLTKDIMLFPAVDPRSGPFQGWQHHWSVDENTLSSGQRFVALSFYLALTTADCLDITGADGPVIVEGPFTRNRLYLDMLQAAAGRTVEAADGSLTGTSIGAALLVSGEKSKSFPMINGPIAPRTTDLRFQKYAENWTRLVRHMAH